MDEKLKGLFGDDPVMFLKFSDNPKNLLSLQQGNVYMNNLKFFVDLEAETGIPGMGDKQEVLNVVNDVELSFYKQGTEDLAFKAKAKQITMRYEDALYKPVFCMFAVTVDMIKVIEESDKELKLAFDFSDELITKMRSEFGEHVLVISPAQFKNKIHKSFSEKIMIIQVSMLSTLILTLMKKDEWKCSKIKISEHFLLKTMHLNIRMNLGL